VPKSPYFLTLLAAMATQMCVPSEPAPKGDKSRDNDLAYRPSDLSFRKSHARPSGNVPATTVHTTSSQPDAEKAPIELAPIVQPYTEHFDGPKLSPDWNATSSIWQIENGRLCGRLAHNHPAWLARRLPKNARISFSAESDSPEGDLKVEVWGDGHSGATGISYTNASSYLFILGGWKNQLHVLARLNEHGADRVERHVNAASTDPRDQRVQPGTRYQFQIERNDGRTVRWSVNGVEIHRFVDQQPLMGTGHDHLAFNDWEAHVCFDDLNIIPLPS
jgi:hypothetical protein